MSPTRLLIAVFALLVLVAAVTLWRVSGDKMPVGFALLNEEELAERADTPQDQVRAMSVTRSSGPVIKVAAPSGFSLNSPVDFDVRIEPRGGVAVDVTSLRIEYKLGPAWVNLTRRIMRQATIKGSRFMERGAQLPPGNHALRLTVRDEIARTTQALVTFSVAK